MLGAISFTGATVTVGGRYSVAGTTYVSAGEVDFSSSASTGTLMQVGGTIGGSGILTVTGPTKWTGGTMSGTGTTNADGGLTIGDPGSNEQMFLDQRTINNAGDATFADAYPVYPYGLFLSSGATIDNQKGASFAFISDASVIDGGGSPDGGSFINDGILSKTGGTGTSSSIGNGITLNNSGNDRRRIGHAQSPRRRWRDFGSIHLAASLGADLDFGAGTLYRRNRLIDQRRGCRRDQRQRRHSHRQRHAYSVAGPPTSKAAGEVDFNASASTGVLTQVGGTIGGSGTLTVTGLDDLDRRHDGGLGDDQRRRRNNHR